MVRGLPRPSLRDILLWACLLGLLLLQVFVGRMLKPYRAAIDQMPFPPSALAFKTLALGDDQFLFRSSVSWLQDVGDGGGRLVPLREFDYHLVVDWLRLIDRLDPQSDAVFQLGSTYFGAISDFKSAPVQLPPLIEFFSEAAMADPARRWHWLVWCAVKIQHVVKDSDKALAERVVADLLLLKDDPRAPEWLPLLAGPVLRDIGEKERAAALADDPEMIERRRRANETLRAVLRQWEKE